MSELLTTICGVIFVLIGAAETFRAKDNASQRLMGIMVAELGIIIIGR